MSSETRTLPYDTAAGQRFPALAWRRRWLLLVVALLAGLAGCAAPEKPADDREPEVLAFPPAPEQARFYFDRMLNSSASVTELTDEIKLRHLLTGESGVKIAVMAKPFGVAVHRGRVFVTDSAQSRVHVFDYRDLKYFTIAGGGGGGVVKPLGIAVDAAGNVYVVDIGRQGVLVFDRDGNYLRAFGGKELLDRPGSIAVEPDGSRAYVVDTGGIASNRHRVVVFDARSGDYLHAFGSRGKGDGEFNLPREIALGPDGRLYVVDGGNWRVQVFEPDGTFVRKFGEIGRQHGQFSRPKGIAVDATGNVYVVDAAFGNFQIFTPEGKLLLFIGTRAGRGGPAEYYLPAGIDVDEDGRVYVVDQYFRKVDIFRPAELPQKAGYLSERLAGPAK